MSDTTKVVPTEKEVEQFAAALDRMFEQRPGTGFGVCRTHRPDAERQPGLVCLERLGFFFDYARAKAAVLADQAKMAPGERMVWTRPDYTMVSPPYAWVIMPITPAQWLEAKARGAQRPPEESS
jgi:hypothetical protein